VGGVLAAECSDEHERLRVHDHATSPSPNIDPARITATLGVDPQASWKRGDTRIDSQGESRPGADRESYWTGRLMPAPQLSSENSSIKVELLQILARLRQHHEFLLKVRSEDASSELHVSLFARQEFRLDFQPSTLALLDRLGPAVALEVHPDVPAPRPRSSAN